MILGLDASTAVTAWCLLEDQKVKEVGYIQFNKQDDLYQKLFKLRNQVKELTSKYPITQIAIESAAKMFGNGKSSAHTMSMLQRWNGMVSAAIAIDTSICPELIEPSTARKLAQIPITRTKDKKAKELVVEYLQQHGVLSPDTWRYKRTGKLKDWCYDLADACVVALACWKLGQRTTTKDVCR